MTEQEQKDLETMKTEQVRLLYTMLSHLTNIETDCLANLTVQGIGKRSREQFLMDTFIYYRKRINKLAQDHVRKYPDQK